MISVDDLVKIVLVFSVSFSVVALTVQLVRLISKLVDLLDDSRKTLSNFNDLSTFALEDYVEARGAVRQALSSFSMIGSALSNPVGIIGKIKGLVKNSAKNSED